MHIEGPRQQALRDRVNKAMQAQTVSTKVAEDNIAQSDPELWPKALAFASAQRLLPFRSQSHPGVLSFNS